MCLRNLPKALLKAKILFFTVKDNRKVIIDILVTVGLLTILLKGKNGDAYNVSNPESHMQIVDMANMVAEKIGDNKIKVVFDIPDDNRYGYAADTKMKINSDKLQALGWQPKVGLEEAYRRMIKDMIEQHN